MQTNCPLCGNTTVKLLFYKEEIPYYTCSRCRFEFSVTDTNANLENAISDFETPYLQYFDNKAADGKNHAAMLKWILKKYGQAPANILDIGCGSGKWVQYLAEQGYDACGIEPSGALYDKFLAGNPAFVMGTVDSYIADNPGKKFAIITAFDVLEHIKEPLSFLQHAASLLHPSSLFFLSMPDNGSFYRRLAGKRWHYFNRYHYSYFNKKTLTAAAGKAGLKPVEFSHRRRYFQTSYIVNYAKSFVFGKKIKQQLVSKGIIMPVNLFDNLYCVLRKA